MTTIQAPLDRPPQDAAAAPPITKAAAQAIIVARLRALGHPPDLLDQQALAALMEHANGSGKRLRAALASVLFLASTEDAPRIGRTLVGRALQESGDIPAAPPVPRATRRYLFPAGAVAGAVLIAALFVSHPWSPRVASLSTKPDQTVTVQANPMPAPGELAGRPEQAPDHVAPSPPPAPPQAPAAAPAPAPAMSAHPPAPSPEAAAGTAAAGAPNLPAAPPPNLPAAPPARVVLMVSTRDAAAAQRLDGLMRHLRDVGINQVVTQPSPSAHARRAVSYFFADDLPLALRITQILAGEEWPRLASNSLAPRLVIPPPGLPQRQPGLIEVRLP